MLVLPRCFPQAGLGYFRCICAGILRKTQTPAIVKVFSALVLASMICLVGFLGFWFWTRQICNRLYEDCRKPDYIAASAPIPRPDNTRSRLRQSVALSWRSVSSVHNL